jgi:hypothetical protein
MRNFLTRTVKAGDGGAIVPTVNPFVLSTKFGFGKVGVSAYIFDNAFYCADIYAI